MYDVKIYPSFIDYPVMGLFHSSISNVKMVWTNYNNSDISNNLLFLHHDEPLLDRILLVDQTLGKPLKSCLSTIYSHGNVDSTKSDSIKCWKGLFNHLTAFSTFNQACASEDVACGNNWVLYDNYKQTGLVCWWKSAPPPYSKTKVEAAKIFCC